MVHINNYRSIFYFRNFTYLFCLCLILSSNSWRNTQATIIYSANAGVINLKNVSHHFKGVGTTYDAQAIHKALAEARSHAIVYLLNNTYQISNTLRANKSTCNKGTWIAVLSVQGQNRAGTIIKPRKTLPGQFKNNLTV